METNTIYAVSADGQERQDTVRKEKIAETIKRLKNKGYLNIKVIQ
jgi:hypothetical protein